jgi:mannose-6-phosphate isomerase-like protein (cupin superfamily)
MRNYGIVEKGWGFEEIFVSNNQYCGKFLHFNEGAKFSMHFHANKQETWYVVSGKFKLEIIDTENASTFEKILNEKDTWTNMPLVPHRLTCIEKGTVLEISTPDSVQDNYRVLAGDSQK